MFRKFILLTTIVCAALSASAEFRWGPTAGVNFSTLKWKQNLLDTKGRTGFQAGVAAELMIPGIGFGIDLGLRYGMNGANENFGDFEVWNSDGIKNQNVWFHTVQIPVNLKFKWTRMNGFEQTLAPFVFGGPVFNFNVATNDQPALEHPAGFVALQCGAGVELFEHWQLSGGYSWGISYQVNTIKLNNYSAQQRGGFINLAYLF
ncbi:MAG: PorT family protein [Bacteroides sp.]|nr:PorT family protein [Bacteroides sp.]MDE6076717.1 PorT family protein [Muribaculaceae bacterium]MDE6423171.1 PorT family protein [Muribaculaceae bacterium]